MDDKLTTKELRDTIYKGFRENVKCKYFVNRYGRVIIKDVDIFGTMTQYLNKKRIKQHRNVLYKIEVKLKKLELVYSSYNKFSIEVIDESAAIPRYKFKIINKLPYNYLDNVYFKINKILK